MTTNSKPFDFTACEDRVAMLTTDELIGGLHDIQQTLAGADALDRANGTDLGGRYRDEASVYRAELACRPHFEVVGTVDGERFELGLYTDGDEADARAFDWRAVQVPGAMVFVQERGPSA